MSGCVVLLFFSAASLILLTLLSSLLLRSRVCACQSTELSIVS